MFFTIEKYILFGFSIISFWIFLPLIIIYLSNLIKKNLLVFCQIHILIFSYILSICNLIGIYIFFSEDGGNIIYFQAYLWIIGYSGIQSSQLSLISLNLLSFRFPVFMDNHKALSKLIIVLIIYLPIIIYIMPDVILTISNTGDLMYDILDIYYYGDTSLFHNIYDCILGIAFLCILISLHCLVHRYFKQHTDDSEQPYSKKLKKYYISLFFTYPTIVLGIIASGVFIDSPNKIYVSIYISIYILIMKTYPFIITMIYCFNRNIWLLIKELLCCNKQIIDNKNDKNTAEVLLSSIKDEL